jgi:hypothetical protein
MERHELLERLAPLIPPPRAHQVRYHGVLAPCASGRNRVVPSPAEILPAAVASAGHEENPVATVPRDGVENREPLGTESEPHSLRAVASDSRRSLGSQADQGAAAVTCGEPVGAPSAPIARRYAWAELLQRVFEVDALGCPSCGERMRILAAITDPAVARRILKCLGQPPRAPPLTLPAPPEPTTGSWFSGAVSPGLLLIVICTTSWVLS